MKLEDIRKNEKMVIGLQIAEILCLLLAIIVAYQMYNYKSGWDAGINFMRNSKDCLIWR